MFQVIRLKFTLRTIRHFSNVSTKQHFKLIIAGGGSAGTSSAHKFVHKLNKDQLAVIEPSDIHYYQPMWTLVGAGLKTIDQSFIPMEKALPKNITRFKEYVSEFDPDNNTVVLSSGKKLTYDYLIVALGIQVDFNLIPGASEALKNDDRVASNYSIDTVQKTFASFKNFKGGNALFSFPNTPVKCAGAPQKIMYLFDDFLRNEKKRNEATIHYFTTLPVIFPVKKYADSLTQICKSRDLNVNTRMNLIEVDPLKHTAKFEHLDTKEKKDFEYDLLHITPPMHGYDVIRNSKLSDQTGFVAVDSASLQHKVYKNVFAIGDCTNLPTSKTAAAISVQHNVAFANLYSLMNGSTPDKLKYNGYTSCPFVTRHNKCILAEFDYSGQPLETFPFDQSNESTLAYWMKAHIMPQLYWHGFIRGYWNGPGFIRKAMHLGMGK